MVERCSEDGVAELTLRNKFAAGDEIEIVGPGLRPFAMTAPAMTGEEGEALTEVRKPQMRFTMRLPRYVPPLSVVRVKKDALHLF